MTEQTTHSVLTHPVVRAYLRDIETALAPSPAAERALVMEEIAAHIVETAGDAPDDARIRKALDDLGDPATVAYNATRDDLAFAPEGGFLESRWGGVLTVLALAFGGILIPVVGWIAGVAMLWLSKGWTKGEKILGTLVLPGGFVGLLLTAGLPVWLFTASIGSCETTSDTSTAVCETPSPLMPTVLDGAAAVTFLLLIMAQITASIFLLVRFRVTRR